MHGKDQSRCFVRHAARLSDEPDPSNRSGEADDESHPLGATRATRAVVAQDIATLHHALHTV